MGLMDAMIKGMDTEKKEEMMIGMMPLMMEGIDMNSLMPKMMLGMLEDLTAEQIIEFVKDLLNSPGKIKDLAGKMVEANILAEMMKKMMFITYKSALSFDDTVEKLRNQARENGWIIPGTRDIQEEYRNDGIEGMTKMKVLYFCNPRGGFSILQNDADKAMSVMMPMGVSVYEKADGSVEIAGWNLRTMGGFFTGNTKEVLSNGAANFEKSLEGIVA